jgi:hypothetical protein
LKAVGSKLLGSRQPAPAAPRAQLPIELTQGPVNQRGGVVVYYGLDPNTRQPVYVGITNDLARRAREHGPRFGGLRLVQNLVTGSPLPPMTGGEARAVEEYLIRANPTFQNARHEIAPGRSISRDAADFARQVLH